MEALDGLDPLTPSPTSSAGAMASPTSTGGGSITDKLISIQGPEVDPDSCELLGPFALIIQGIMGLIVLGSLLVKRQRERPRRAPGGHSQFCTS